MNFVLSLLRETALIPATVSTVVAAIMVRNPRISSASGAVALAAGFFAGWAAQDWTTLQPARYLDWLPWAAILLSMVALLSSAGLPKKAVWPLTASACVAVTWLLVPNFPRLQPPRPQALGMIAVTSVVLVAALEPLARRVGARILTGCFMATGTAGSIVLAQSFSLKFAQVIGILTAALAGNFLFGKSESATSSLGLSLVFMPVLTNLMFIGYATSPSDVPAFCYAILPIAPLALWLAAFAENGKHSTKRGLVATIVAVAVVLLTAIYPAVMAHPPWEVD